MQERNTMRIAYCVKKLLLRLALAGKVWTALAIQGNANADALQRVAKMRGKTIKLTHHNKYLPRQISIAQEICKFIN